MTPIMRVVAGAWINDTGQVLMGRRPSDGLRPELWELPGGKIDGRETPEEALRREWQEELQLEMLVGELISVAAFEVERPIIVELYRVRPLLYLRYTSNAHSELRWVAPLVAIEHLPCSPAFYLHYPRLRDAIARKDP